MLQRCASTSVSSLCWHDSHRVSTSVHRPASAFAPNLALAKTRAIALPQPQGPNAPANAGALRLRRDASILKSRLALSPRHMQTSLQLLSVHQYQSVLEVLPVSAPVTRARAAEAVARA